MEWKISAFLCCSSLAVEIHFLLAHSVLLVYLGDLLAKKEKILDLLRIVFCRILSALIYFISCTFLFECSLFEIVITKNSRYW